MKPLTHQAKEDDLDGDRVRFRLRDIRIPPPSELLDALWGDQVLEGHLVSCSRTDEGGMCAVVKVSGMKQMVVVPMDSLLSGI